MNQGVDFMNTDSRIGEINRNTKGHLMKIIKYTNLEIKKQM